MQKIMRNCMAHDWVRDVQSWQRGGSDGLLEAGAL